MGKYMKKSKVSSELGELGVLTRAKTLALKNLKGSPAAAGGGGAYLELRSRRLVKPSEVKPQKNAKSGPTTNLLNPSPSPNQEGSFGENMVEFDGRKRTTRESTPCSLIRDPENIQTPGSSTRRIHSGETSSRVLNLPRTHGPAAHEMDEFFTGAEAQLNREFIEKYNFDLLNEKPLPGPFEWVKVDC